MIDLKRLATVKHTIKTSLGQLLFENKKEVRDFEKIKKIELIVEQKVKELEFLELNIKPTICNKVKIDLIEFIENKSYEYLNDLFLDENTIQRIKKNYGELVFSKDGYKFIVKNYSVIKVYKDEN